MKRLTPRARLLLLPLLAALQLGCGGSGGGNNNTPVNDTPQANTVTFAVKLDAMQVVAGSPSGATADAEFILDLDSNSFSGSVQLPDLQATAVQIREGLAGATGPTLIEMESADDEDWAVPADTVLTATQREALDRGRLYVLVTSAAAPEGLLRGQLLGDDLELLFFTLSGEQEVPTVETPATGWAAMTLDPGRNNIAIHVNTLDLVEPGASHIHRALAGVNGPVVVPLSQDPEMPGHWFAEDITSDTVNLDELDDGLYYVNVHTPAHPGGELRGQIPGANVDIVFSDLSAADVVPPTSAAATGILASTIDLQERRVTFHLNNDSADDATGASIRQAPLAQNGPVAVALERDSDNFAHWFALDAPLSDSQFQALRNRGMYAIVSTPAFPAGALRGQIVPDNSMMGSAGSFLVTASTPANGATLGSFPASVQLQFNAAPFEASAAQFELLASGGDGSFGEPNDTPLAVITVQTQGNELTLDFGQANAGNDSYQLTVSGSGATALSDEDGRILDGDRDGTAGGDAITTFLVLAAPGPGPSAATLSQIQNEIFNNSCAFSGCHAGGSPAAGMNLSSGQSFSNLVNRPSSQNASLTRVIPFDANGSLIVQKLEGTAPVGSRMPLGRAPLSNSEIQTVREWIDAGAENN
jgi:hypothetical protein